VNPDAIIERVWPGETAAGAITVEPLGGGITNHNFVLTRAGERFVLRIGGKDTDLLGIDRSVEEAAARMAAAVGVGPEVVEVVRPEGYLVTRFIVSEPIPVERMREPDMTELAAAAIRAFHYGPAIPGRFDAHRVVEAYRDTAARHGVAIPERFEWAHAASTRIERARGPLPLVPCHNDFLNANFLLEPGGAIRIVDWEYAGMGDRFFDLGNFSINHGFEPDHDRSLLSAYFGTPPRDEDFAALRLMRFMSDFREAMWGVVQQGISELDFDFVNYADEHFERLRATAADPRFETWLEAVATGVRSHG
jgi:thiamine kinase-like enzyme